jgi:hypothetical protein
MKVSISDPFTRTELFVLYELITNLEFLPVLDNDCHNGQTESTNVTEVNLIYRCPICREEAQEKTITCDECNEWYHDSCFKLSQLEINKIDANIPYICDFGLCAF